MPVSKKPIVPSWHGIKVHIDSGYCAYNDPYVTLYQGSYYCAVMRRRRGLVYFYPNGFVRLGALAYAFTSGHYGHTRNLRCVNAFLPYGWSIATDGSSVSLKHNPTNSIWAYTADMMITDVGVSDANARFISPLSRGRSTVLVYYSWEFKQTNQPLLSWHREVNQYSSIDEAVETCGEMHNACTECSAHRLVRVETLPDSRTFVTPVLYTANSVPKQLRKVQGLRRSAAGA
jgi:hypothetical protein